ncbi:hypothetical protein F8388_020063 [Cannabis sativa]|uniref:Uncharacterized protein n=1 Tax=Cannabis sativa TaxID=3483 RepID=A0A7J6F7K9_CANSA|nr:hypothetical protein F8388_020063 [Cannabis sativa]
MQWLSVLARPGLRAPPFTTTNCIREPTQASTRSSHTNSFIREPSDLSLSVISIDSPTRWHKRRWLRSGAEEGGAAAGHGGGGRATEDLHGVKAIPKIMDVDCVDMLESGREIRQSAIDGNSEFMESDDDANIEEDLVMLMESKRRRTGRRSKQLWLREGDSNSKYFHASATSRRRRNSIQKLKDSDGVWVDWKGCLPSVMAMLPGITDIRSRYGIDENVFPTTNDATP